MLSGSKPTALRSGGVFSLSPTVVLLMATTPAVPLAEANGLSLCYFELPR